MKKKFRIIMLPTENGVIWKFDASKTLIVAQGTMVSDVPFKKYDLFAVSDYGITEGDKVVHKDSILTVSKNRGLYLTVEELSHIDVRTDTCKKIVATTDKGLGLPDNYTLDQLNLQIPQINASYVRWYVEKANDSGVPVDFVDLEGEIRYGVNGNDPNEKRYEYFKLKTNEDNTVIIHHIKPLTNEEMYLNMQYYYEYVRLNGYVTPQCWIEKHKHF